MPFNHFDGASFRPGDVLHRQHGDDDNGVSDDRCVMVVSNWAEQLFSSSPSVLLLGGLGLYSWLGPQMALHICPAIP